MLGGSTWSYQPPQSSQVTKIAVLGHSPPRTMAFTWSTVHCIPCVTLPTRGSLRSLGSGACSLASCGAYTHDTDGNFLAVASWAKSWDENRGRPCSSLMTSNTKP